MVDWVVVGWVEAETAEEEKVVAGMVAEEKEVAEMVVVG